MRIINLLLLLLGSFGMACAQSGLQNQIDTYFRDIARQSPAPGFSVVVVQGEEILFCQGYGREQIDQPKPMRAETVTAIGSLTKSFTALAILQLVDAGKVELNDPVVKYLPEFRTANPDQSRLITVSMLLNNSSGLPGGVSQIHEENGSAALLSSIRAIYLNKIPGETYEYSNLAFSIAGLIIERVSGLSYADYLEKNIFQPLEMYRSSTDPADFIALQALNGHHLGLSQAIPAPRTIELSEMAAAGSVLRSNAVDMGHYLLALMNDGQYKQQSILRPQRIKELYRPQVSFPGLSYEQGGDGQEYHYGLGWMISDIEGRRLVHHGGSRATMSSFTLLYPEAKLAATILFNIDYNYVDPYSFSSPFQILNNLFHLILEEPFSDFGQVRISDLTLNSFELPASRQQRFIGEYHFSGEGDRRNFQGSRLELFRAGNTQLAAKIYQGRQLLSHFELDFVNETRAVSRNLAATQDLRFIVQPDGTVRSLYYGVSRFQKISPAFRQKHTEVSVGRARFFFPKDWNWEVGGTTFSAHHKKNNQLRLEGGQLAQTKRPAPLELLRKHFPDAQIIFSGLAITEARGAQLWRQQSFRSEYAGNTRQHLILCNEHSGFYLVLSTPDGQLVAQSQAIATLLLDTYASTP